MDSTKIRENQNHELSQLNQDFQKRKDKLVEQRQNEIDQLRKYYDEKEENVRNQSEAAINHIRQRTKESVEEEKTTASKNIEGVKRSLGTEKQVYEKNLYQQRQLQQERLKKINSDFEEKRQNTVEEHHGDIEKIHDRHAKSLKDSQDHYSKQHQKIQSQNEQNLTQAQSRGQTQLIKVSQTYRDQIDKVHNEGEKKLHTEKTRQDTILNQIRTESKESLEKEHKLNAQRLEQEQNQFRDRYETSKERHNDEMRQQSQIFGEDLDQRQRQMERNLAAQERLFNREILKQKLDWAEEMKPFESQKDDPFYKIIDRKSDFEETATAFKLRTYLPQYDQKSIRISVQPDKVSVQGSRSFKDETHDDIRKVASQQYQSFREEFQFTQPVVEKAVVQERDGDYVTVTIPKLSSTPSKTSRNGKLGWFNFQNLADLTHRERETSTEIFQFFNFCIEINDEIRWLRLLINPWKKWFFPAQFFPSP